MLAVARIWELGWSNGKKRGEGWRPGNMMINWRSWLKLVETNSCWFNIHRILRTEISSIQFQILYNKRAGFHQDAFILCTILQNTVLQTQTRSTIFSYLNLSYFPERLIHFASDTLTSCWWHLGEGKDLPAIVRKRCDVAAEWHTWGSKIIRDIECPSVCGLEIQADFV